MLPYLINGSNAYFVIHDFLDSSVAHYKNIKTNGMFFSLSGNIPLMEDVDRMTVAFSSPFELKALIFYFLPIYWAIFVNMVLVKICAFVGMFLLLNKYITPQNRILNFIVSVIFCMIPFYVDYGISSAGNPLLCYAFFNLKNRIYVKQSLLLTFLYAFYSSLSMSGLFVCFLLTISIIMLYYKEKEIDLYLLSALAILLIAYLFANWRMISGFMFPSEIVSHRQDWTNSHDFIGLTFYWLTNIVNGQYHAGDFFAIPFVIIFIFVYIKYRNRDKQLYNYLLAFVVLVSLIVMGTYVKMVPIKLFTAFQFDRFYFLYASLCFVLLAKSVVVLFDGKKKYLAILSIFIATFCVGVRNIEFLINAPKIFGKQVSRAPSLDQFYDETLFAKICKDLNVEQNYSTRVVSVGIYPSVAEFNGLWSLDAYMNSYSLAYKHKFRKVIEKELDKSELLKDYFDYWGSRCYLFSSELGKKYIYGKKDGTYVNNLDINTNALKNLGCQYILSAVVIDNYKELGLSYVNSFSTPKSYWNIRVYKLI